MSQIKARIDGHKESSKTPNIISREIKLTEKGVVLKIMVNNEENKTKTEEIAVDSIKKVVKDKVLDKKRKLGKEKLDKVVKNIKEPELLHSMEQSKTALLQHIETMKKLTEEEKPIPNITSKRDVPKRHGGQTHSSWDEFTANVMNLIDDRHEHIINDLDAYIQKVVSLPEEDDGRKQAPILGKYLTKLSKKDPNLLSEDDLQKIDTIVRHEPIDYKGLVSICKGHEDCGNISCPLYKIGKEPLGERCPIEEAYVEDLIKGYLDQLLIDEYDMIGVVEYNLIINLVECDLMDMRLRNLFNLTGYLIDDISVDPKTGTRVVNKKANPLIDIRKQNDHRKSTILKSLLATPEIKKRLNIRAGKGSATKAGTVTGDQRVKALLNKVQEHRKLLEVKSKKKRKN